MKSHFEKNIIEWTEKFNYIKLQNKLKFIFFNILNIALEYKLPPEKYKIFLKKLKACL